MHATAAAAALPSSSGSCRRLGQPCPLQPRSLLTQPPVCIHAVSQLEAVRDLGNYALCARGRFRLGRRLTLNGGRQWGGGQGRQGSAEQGCWVALRRNVVLGVSLGGCGFD